MFASCYLEFASWYSVSASCYSASASCYSAFASCSSLNLVAILLMLVSNKFWFLMNTIDVYMLINSDCMLLVSVVNLVAGECNSMFVHKFSCLCR